ncbi:MAG: primosomal protein N' [Holosporales bacterium]|nr:primosomal protein N' [Holosporales bacterium]
MNYNIAVLKELDWLYTYFFDDVLDFGQLVVVDFRNKESVGIVINNETVPNFSGKIKTIKAILPYKISEKYVEFADFVAKYNLVKLGSVLKLLVPFSVDSILSGQRKSGKNECKQILEHVELNQDQRTAVSHMLKYKDTFKTILLHGITGSGKTEVFLEFIANVINDCFSSKNNKEDKGTTAQQSGKQVLILVPEIALLGELTKKVSQRLGINVFTWHNSVSRAKKLEIWKKAVDGDDVVVVGTRSAIFIPLRNLSVIVVDEEHDQSFKQSETTTYHARDMAIYLGCLLGIPVVLSSATPSVESYNNTLNGRYEYVELVSRYFPNAILPTVLIDDLRKEKQSGILSKFSIQEIKNCLKSEKQVLIFVNRRGHTPKIFCKTCGWKMTCPACSSWLCYHLATNELLCHYCGFTTFVRSKCEKCGSSNLTGIGIGVEKMEEECKELFPEAKIFVLSSDTVDTPNKILNAVEKIKNNEVDIIIGTQIIAKGHNFNDLNLVVIVCVDAMLYGEDFRSIERTFQTIFQVAGRAGRTGEDVSKVVIQTYNPDDCIIEILRNNDIKQLYSNEIRNRKITGMPPFGKMATIVVSALSESIVANVAKNLVKIAPYDRDLKIIGPIQPVVYKIRSRYRLKIVVLSAKRLQNYIKNWLANYKKSNKVRILIDIDPQDCH